MANARQWQPRHTVLSVLFVTSMVSYLDRMVMSIAIPYIGADFHLSPVAMGGVMSIFFASYAISQIPGGMLADRFGFRRVATIALLWWSAFTAITGAAANLSHMLLARLFFGFGEGAYPTCAFKAVAVWFPKRERGTANAVLLSAGPIGAALAPLVVVPIVAAWGWREVFYALCVPGVAMAFLFWTFVKDGPEKEHGQALGHDDAAHGETENEPGVPDKALRFTHIVRQPNIIQFILVYFFFDIAYWGLTNWLPTYLVRARGFSMVQMGVAAALPQIVGVIGSFMGGWLSDRYFSNARKAPIIASQILSALFLYLTYTTTEFSLVVVYQIFAGFSLNFFFTAFWAVPMSSVPVARMGVTTGIINTAGQTAAFISPVLVGYLVGASGGNFDATFMLFIASLLISCLVVFTVRRPPQDKSEEGTPATEQTA